MAKTEKPKVADKVKAATGKTKTKASKGADNPAKPKPTSNASAEGAKAKVGVVKGKVEKATGKAAGNKKLEAKGSADEKGAKSYGKAQKARKKLSK